MGHTISGPNYGAVGIIKESEETRRLGKEVKCLLQKQGHTVIDCTIDKALSNSDSINRRVSKVNAQRLDLFVSIHFNSGGGTGCEVLTYKGKYLIEADKILENMESIGFRNRGIKDAVTYKGDKVAVIYKTRPKSLLIETCFVDSIDDINRYKDNINKIAAAIVGGITGKTLDSSSISANKNNPIALYMQQEIKLIQGTYGFKQDGIATDELINKLPDLKGYERRGIVTIMQRILILKGFLSRKSATGVIGPANRNAINRFKESVGIPTDTTLVDRQTWRKLLEY